MRARLISSEGHIFLGMVSIGFMGVTPKNEGDRRLPVQPYSLEVAHCLC